MNRLLVWLLSLLLAGCVSTDTIRVELPSNVADGESSKRLAIVVLEKTGTRWETKTVEQEILDSLNETPKQIEKVVEPQIQIKAPHEHKCEAIFVMPDMGNTPALPTLGAKGMVGDDHLDSLAYGHIGQLRKYINNMKKTLKKSYSDYLENVKRCQAG